MRTTAQRQCTFERGVEEAISPIEDKIDELMARLGGVSISMPPAEEGIKHYEGREFIIVDSEGSLVWRFPGARKYCQKTFGTDLFAINSFQRQIDVLGLAIEKGIKEKGWIGLTDEENEGIWKWVNGEETNDFVYWKPGSPDELNTDVNNAMIRFDEFGGGWDDVKFRARTSVLICSHR